MIAFLAGSPAQTAGCQHAGGESHPTSPRKRARGHGAKKIRSRSARKGRDSATAAPAKRQCPVAL